MFGFGIPSVQNLQSCVTGDGSAASVPCCAWIAVAHHIQLLLVQILHTTSPSTDAPCVQAQQLKAVEGNGTGLA